MDNARNLRGSRHACPGIDRSNWKRFGQLSTRFNVPWLHMKNGRASHRGEIPREFDERNERNTQAECEFREATRRSFCVCQDLSRFREIRFAKERIPVRVRSPVSQSTWPFNYDPVRWERANVTDIAQRFVAKVLESIRWNRSRSLLQFLFHPRALC